MSPARAHPPSTAEGGFALIEVIISAFIIVLVGSAVLTVLQATTRSAASERSRSVAFAIAQQDQARLRSMRLTGLNRLHQVNPVNIDGEEFTVESTGIFVNSSSGTSSCSGTGTTSADYVRITTSVTWPGIRGDPVTIQSLVAPSTGSLDPNHGTLAISVKNAAGQPLSGVGIVGSGAGSFNGTTDSEGCATFADLPSGNYTVTPSGTNLVDKNGEPPKGIPSSVTASGTNPLVLLYDHPGSVRVKFTYLKPSNGIIEPASSDSIFVFNSGMTKGKAFWTATKTRQPTVEATSLFPFTDADAIYAGSCEENKPEIPAGAASIALATIPVNGPAPEQTIQLPVLGVEVWSGKDSANKGPSVPNAHVVIKDKKCATAVKRDVTLSAGVLPEPWMPWGTYEVCADNGSRKNTVTVAVGNLSGPTNATVYLGSGNPPNGSSNGQCS